MIKKELIFVISSNKSDVDFNFDVIKSHSCVLIILRNSNINSDSLSFFFIICFENDWIKCLGSQNEKDLVQPDCLHHVFKQ